MKRAIPASVFAATTVLSMNVVAPPQLEASPVKAAPPKSSADSKSAPISSAEASAASQSTFVEFPKQSLGVLRAFPIDADFHNHRLDFIGMGQASGRRERPLNVVFGIKLNYQSANNFASLSHLKADDLALIDSNEMEVAADQFKYLKTLTGLRRLELKSSDLSDAQLQELKTLHGLRFLDASKTLIKGPGLAVLANLPNLQTLDLSYTPLDGANLVFLQKLPDLRQLFLTSTNLDDQDLIPIGKLKALRGLKLMDNRRITDAGVARLGGLQNLLDLTLTDTSISIASLPTFKKFKLLKYLRISSKKLSAHDFSIIKVALPNCTVSGDKQSSLPIEIFSPLH